MTNISENEGTFSYICGYNTIIKKSKKMKYIKYLAIVLVVFYACKNSDKNPVENENGIKKITVEDVVHVKDYSYIKSADKWFAVPTTPVQKGQDYYYDKSMEMKDFYSQELNRSFESVHFIEKLSVTPEGVGKGINPHAPSSAVQDHQNDNTTAVKKDINIDQPAGAISIAQLFENPEKYKDQFVTIKGEVTKYNPSIMNVNWFHVQDGTDYNGENDLTVTTTSTVVIGNVVTFKGKVTLNKDFGAGYFYKVIVEQAEIIN